MCDCDPTKEHDTSALCAPGQLSPPPDPSPRRRRLWQLLSALSIGVLLCLGVGGGANWQIRGNTISQSPRAMVGGVNMTRQQVIARARPSVVLVYGDSREEKNRGQHGSGVIIDQRGYIVTNFHVVNGTFNTRVRLFDNSPWLNARLVGLDPVDDLAVLKINTPKRLSVMSIGNSSQLQVGDSVLAIGNPDSAPQTVTGGIVSALGRLAAERRDGQLIPLIDMVQTDAAINPGNSGGALVNMQGELVGMPTLGFDPSLFTLLNFAIPANRIKFVAPQLIQYGKLVHNGHASIGATTVSVSAELAAQNSLPVNQGALVTDVVAGGPAERAGLKPDDVIIRLNDIPITNALDLTDALALVNAGSFVTLEVVRDGQHMQISVKTYEDMVKVASSWACPLRDAQPVVGKG